MSNADYLISTPENVELHLELAGFGNRVIAGMVDTAITYVACILVAAMAFGLCLAVEYSGLTGKQLTMLNIYFVSVAVLVDFLFIFGYYIYFEGNWQGQTPGKRMMQIRVVEQNGSPVTRSAVFIRNLVRTIDIGLGLIGILLIMFDQKERRLGDLAAATLVIRERPLKPLVVESLFPEAETLAIHVDAGKLTNEQYQIVRSFLSRRNQLTKEARQLLAHRLKKYLLGKVSNGELADKPPELFLEAVYFAYQSRAHS